MTNLGFKFAYLSFYMIGLSPSSERKPPANISNKIVILSKQQDSIHPSIHPLLTPSWDVEYIKALKQLFPKPQRLTCCQERELNQAFTALQVKAKILAQFEFNESANKNRFCFVDELLLDFCVAASSTASFTTGAAPSSNLVLHPADIAVIVIYFIVVIVVGIWVRLGTALLFTTIFNHNNNACLSK